MPALPLPASFSRESRGACPRCRVPLDRVEVGSLEVEPCPSCRGVFLGAIALTRLLVEDEPGDADALAAAFGYFAPAIPDLAPPIAWCPSCARPMQRRRLAGAAIRVAACRVHGVWFDRADFAAVVRALTLGDALGGPLGELAGLLG
jgi:Zn-finger nucleic acid-binding protein